MGFLDDVAEDIDEVFFDEDFLAADTILMVKTFWLSWMTRNWRN